MELSRPNLLAPPTGGPDAERMRQFLDCVCRILGHDLPNHFIALKGLAQLLAVEEEERLTSEGKEYVGRMAAAADRAHALTLSLASAGRLVLQPPTAESVDVAEAVAEALAVVKALCPRHTVAYDVPQAPYLVTVPRLSLDRVLVGLLRQACSVASEHGTVRVNVEAKADTEPVEVSISDVSNSPSIDANGNRDLFIARLLVEAWGGRLRLAAEPTGRQTAFVTCPR
jgi:signal transduction histidine kinase